MSKIEIGDQFIFQGRKVIIVDDATLQPIQRDQNLYRWLVAKDIKTNELILSWAANFQENYEKAWNCSKQLIDDFGRIRYVQY